MRAAYLIIVDALLLLLAGLLGLYARFNSDAAVELTRRHVWLKLLLVSAVVQVSLYLFDLYAARTICNLRKIVESSLKAFVTTMVMLSILFYAVPALTIGRGIFLISLGFGFALVVGFRLFHAWSSRHPQIGIRERILILGSGEQAIEVARATLERRTTGYHIAGFVDDKPELLGKSLINPSVIGLTEDLEALVAQNRIDRIVVAVQDRRGNFPVKELLNLRLGGVVAVEEGARYYERLTGKVATDLLRPSWLIFSTGSRFSDFHRRLRDVVNRGLAAAGLVLSLPMMLVVAIAVKLESRGPVFYTQERVGRCDRRFKIIKFRSMGVGAEAASGPVWATESDPRVTRVGRIIRKLRLDELPQFINVLRGDMNFIGPRPERPEFVEELARVIPYYSERHLVKPGLTGWAQVKYPYGASMEDSREKLQYDLYYIKNQSWLLDAGIIFETVKIVLFGRGAR